MREYLNIVDLEKIAIKSTPTNTQENPAYPNYSDDDIYVEGFIDGYEYCSDANPLPPEKKQKKQ